MTKKIEVRGTVEKIVRANGKTDAQVVISIPVKESIDVPLGRVTVTVQALQPAMFGAEENDENDGEKSKKNKKN